MIVTYYTGKLTKDLSTYSLPNRKGKRQQTGKIKKGTVIKGESNKFGSWTRILSPVVCDVKTSKLPKDYHQITVTIPDNPPPVQGGTFPFRFAWDDENSEYNYKARSLAGDWTSVESPPAVLRYYPVQKDDAGDFRVRMSGYENDIIAVNGGGEEGKRRYEFLIGSARALYNQTGWDRQAYISMSGNRVAVIGHVAGWYQIKTLKRGDSVAGMTHETHPQFVHSFNCVGHRNGQTVHIESTNTARGKVYYYLMTNEGYAWVPECRIIEDKQ